jgi:uncharacterized protein
MLSIDTNILLPAVEAKNPGHAKAAGFLDSLAGREDVALSEFALVELYGLLRNPAVLKKPLAADAAVAVCQAFRHHPRWLVLGFPPDTRVFHDAFWPLLAGRNLPRRRAYDLRMALSLTRQGVTEFATVNEKDFAGLGFKRVWNPLA